MALIIYDSTYGNTKLIAETIAATLGADTKCLGIDDVRNENLPNDLLVVGCPINAWHPTPKVVKFLQALPPSGLTGVKAAAFDTRLDSFFSGNAAKKIAKGLKNAGATLVVPPQAFYVKGTKGPLIDGQLEKAKNWAGSLRQG